MTYAKRLLKIYLTADEIVEKLLVISKKEQVCLLDSGGVSHLGSHFLLAGIKPRETFEITNEDSAKTLEFLDEKLEKSDALAILTISYEFGLKLEKIEPRKKEFESFKEPDVFLAHFDSLLIHDYDSHETYQIGHQKYFDEIENLLFAARSDGDSKPFGETCKSRIESNFTKAEYLETIEKIKEFIRRGDTYQTNLTQQLRAELPENLTPQQIFLNLRKKHPAPFSSFIQRTDSIVISASPERFFKISTSISTNQSLYITTSPIKGTRPRGKNVKEDEKLKNELLNSEKDRAENVMIVDLLRNDLGRICEFGSVSVEKLCDLEEHPTLFHLVSTVNGTLRENVRFSEMIRAVFPCGSITGAPKIRTMKIIDQLEKANRGLSMGAIGYYVSGSKFQVSKNEISFDLELDLSVAIRTMVIKDHTAIFNVGGGIVIDSNPEDEYEESLIKAKALLKAING